MAKMPKKPRVRKYLGKLQRMEVAKIARKVVKNQAELKYHSELAFTGLGAAYNVGDGCYSLLNNISQGDGDSSERVGDQVRMTSLELRGFITGVNNSYAGRLIIAIAKPGDQSLDTNSAIVYGLDELLFGGASSSALWDVYRNDTRQRFQILYDRTFATNDMAAGISSSVMHFHKMLPLKNKIAQYDAGSQRLTKNAVFAIWFGNSPVTPTNYGPTLQLTTRIRYTDI